MHPFLGGGGGGGVEKSKIGKKLFREDINKNIIFRNKFQGIWGCIMPNTSV